VFRIDIIAIVFTSGFQTAVRVPLIVCEGLQDTQIGLLSVLFTKNIFTAIIFTRWILVTNS